MRKKNLWFGILSLVLCIGIMATGIYAAKQAQLTMGGKLGFTMHECMIEVSGKISNIAVEDENSNGGYTKQDKTIEKAIMGSETAETTTEVQLGNLQFYYGCDMIFELSFKNVGSKEVTSNLSINLMENADKVSLVESGHYDTLPSQKSIPPKTTITYTFALHISGDEAIALSNFLITVTFEESN